MGRTLKPCPPTIGGEVVKVYGTSCIHTGGIWHEVEYEDTPEVDTLAQPISTVVDGYVLSDGDLHLGVKMVVDGVTTIRYVSVPRYDTFGRRRTRRIVPTAAWLAIQ